MKRLALEYWLPLLLWLIIIFFFSTDRFSADETSRFIVPILKFLFPGFSPREIELLHGVIRKFGHVSEYFLLAVFAYRSFSFEESDLAAATVRTFSFVLLAALVDELHQAFTASRGASIADVGYDCFGALCALWLITNYETRRLRAHSVL